MIEVEWEPLDVGVVVAEGDGSFEVLGYMGTTLDWDHLPPPHMTKAEREYPKLAELAKVLKGGSVSEMEVDILAFLAEYTEPDEPVIIVSRTRDLPAILPTIAVRGARYHPSYINMLMTLMAIPTEYEFDAKGYEKLRQTRAVNLAAHNHAELVVQRNNIQGWGEDLYKLSLNEEPIK